MTTTRRTTQGARPPLSDKGGAQIGMCGLPNPAVSIRGSFEAGYTGKVRPSVTAYRALMRAIRPHKTDIIRAFASKCEFKPNGDMFLIIPRSNRYKDAHLHPQKDFVTVRYNINSDRWISDTAAGIGVDTLYAHVCRIRGRSAVDPIHDLCAHVGRAHIANLLRGSRK